MILGLSKGLLKESKQPRLTLTNLITGAKKTYTTSGKKTKEKTHRIIQNVQRLFSCLAGFTFHEIKNNDLPESSSDHTSISTHLKEWCDLLRIFLHPLPYFPCKINKEIHYNFFWTSTFYQDQSVTLKETGPRIKQETQQYYQQDQRTNGLHVNGNRSSRHQKSRHQEVDLPPTSRHPEV